MPCDDVGKKCDASTSQKTPEIAAIYQKLGEKRGTNSSSRPSKETNPADTFILDF